MNIVAKTSVGKVRQNNQDDMSYGKLGLKDSYAVVCDGMGGMAGGEVASSVAVGIITDKIKSSYRENMSSRSIKNSLQSAVIAANAAVLNRANDEPELTGMGTTAVAVMVVDGVANIAHAGDSRAYKISGGEICQITKDHTFVQELFDLGKITKTQMKRDSRKHIITRALGAEDSISVDYCEEDLRDADVILICTDGLTNLVDDDEILSIYEQVGFDCFASKLVDTANEYGGTDNVTVVAMKYQED